MPTGKSTSPTDPSSQTGYDRTITVVFLLICLEGLCGGSAYVNTFYHVGREGGDDTGIDHDGGGDDPSVETEKKKMEREFRIGATGAADSCGECLFQPS
jgi:battenin